MDKGTTSERVTGAVLAVGGLIFAWYSAENYDLGTFRRMGPGMFPLGLGLGLAVLGLAIAVWAPEKGVVRPDFNPLIAAKIVGSIVVFGLTVAQFGLIAAVMATVIVSSLAERPFRPLSALLLGTFLCLLAWLIFRVALGLPIHMLRWPF
ncbi:MAG: tripartite tricarboxylate transporter TctB family protein [Pararhodobacter sp.]|nr:tripartite tricarboxylate transporter TctB family protein [Pararhodobacter sp.]